ncbi:unnamed protein product [Ixodes pacificus]
MYSPRTKKAILPFDSAHSKLVKRGIANLCLRSALQKSCPHAVRESFDLQLHRLALSGFPPFLVRGVAESLLKKMKSPDTETRKRPKKFEVLPYAHRTSHNLKRVGAKFNVDVVFTAPCKLSKLCAMSSGTKSRNGPCDKRHAKQFVPCVKEVVYEIPLSCGRDYLGQTGRCWNDRLREHAASLGSGHGSHLPIHCRDCGCSPALDNTKVVGRMSGKLEREIMEAARILACGPDHCISVASVHLTNRELDFLNCDRP